MRLLTKSRFKLAVDCPPKLYYCNKPDEYADHQIDDSFLAALAEGGFQVGELAKYLFCEDPVSLNITIEEKDYEKSLKLTSEKLFASDNSVVAEAAFRYESLFVRVDITTRNGNTINLYEVKSKSWDNEKSFWKRPKKGEPYLDKDWLPYLYDIAFQKWVVSKQYPDYKVNAYLVLADKEQHASIEGLNQLFRIERNGNRKRVVAKAGLTSSDLGAIPLITLNVDTECEHIYTTPVQIDLDETYYFEDTINLFSQAYERNERIWSPIGRKCKDCQFVNDSPESGLKSGFSECWQHWTKLNPEQLKMPLALELWGGLAGAKSIVEEVIRKGKFFISEIEETDYWPKKFEPREGLHPAERRKLQIHKARQGDHLPHLDIEGLKKLFDQFPPPYHFIDFETTMVALPFHRGRKPYEGIAFQYSYHSMSEKGDIKHENQYISLSPTFPNYDFVRALKKDLEGKSGSIFRYHNHENTYLNLILRQLKEEPNGLIPDRDELIEFIRQITHDDDWQGPQDMNDLWKMVLSYYYSPTAKGSNSIKDILPAVIKDSSYIREKYSLPVYGTEKIPSINFREHTWITEATGRNPYRTLPKVLQGYENDDLDQFAPTVEDIKDGGAAMMAYAYLQFSDVPEKQKELIQSALFRYCELDTMAMVMIWEYWKTAVNGRQ